jgi:hypothetical protein
VVITTADINSTYKVYVQGVTYLPTSMIDVHLKKIGTDVFFRGSVTAFRYSIDGQGNAIPPTPIIETPIFSASPNRTVVWLKVYVCPGGGSCSEATGKLRLLAKVAINDSSGQAVAGSRTISVLSWSVQR